jgi:hypothetical protein
MHSFSNFLKRKNDTINNSLKGIATIYEYNAYHYPSNTNHSKHTYYLNIFKILRQSLTTNIYRSNDNNLTTILKDKLNEWMSIPHCIRAEHNISHKISYKINN